MGPDNQFMFAQYGSGIPGTPVSGNHAPGRADAYMAAQQASMGETLRMQLLASDPRSVMIANRLMDFAGGTGTSTQFSSKQNMERAEQARLMSTLSGIAINNPMLNPYTGGNILNAAVGQSAAFANSQMRFNAMSGTGGMGAVNHFTGAGAATDMLTLAQMKSYNNYFSDSSTGLLKLSKTHGFGHNELGAMQTYLGQSGAYSGMVKGTALMREGGEWDDVRENVKSQFTLDNGKLSREGENLMTAIAEAEEDGRNVAFALGEGTEKRMNDTLSSMAKAMKGLKNVFGGRPMAELMQMAEQMTGGSITTESGFNKLSNRLEDATTFAMGTGIDTGAYLNQQVRVKQTLESYGMGPRVAAAAGERVARDSIVQYQSYKNQRNQLQDRGFYTRDMNLQEFEAINVMDQKKLADEIPETALYALMVQNSGLSKADQAKKMQAMQTALSEDIGTTDPQAQARIQRQRAYDVMQQFAEESGVSVAQMQKRLNTEGDMPATGALAQQFLGDDAATALMEINAAEGQRRNIDSLLPRLASTMNFGDASKKEGEDFTKSVVAVLGRSKIDISDALTGKSDKDWRDIVSNVNISDKEKEFVTKSIETMTERLGGESAVGNAILQVTQNSKLDVRNNNIRSSEDQNITEQAEMTAFLARKAMGGEGAVPTMLSSFARGFLGDEDINLQDTFAYALKGGAKNAQLGTFDMKTNALKMTKEQAESTLKFLTEEQKAAMNLTSAEDLIDKVSTTKGLNEFIKSGRNEDIMFDTLVTEGEVSVYAMDKKEANAKADEARKFQKLAGYKSFYGDSYVKEVLEPHMKDGPLTGDSDFDSIFKSFRLSVAFDKEGGNRRLRATRSQFAKLFDENEDNDKAIMDGLNSLSPNEREVIFTEALKDSENLSNFKGDLMPFFGESAKEKQEAYQKKVKGLREGFRQATGQTYLGKLSIDGDALDLFRMENEE